MVKTTDTMEQKNANLYRVRGECLNPVYAAANNQAEAVALIGVKYELQDTAKLSVEYVAEVIV
jgi:hypothetical protein